MRDARSLTSACFGQRESGIESREDLPGARVPVCFWGHAVCHALFETTIPPRRQLALGHGRRLASVLCSGRAEPNGGGTDRGRWGWPRLPGALLGSRCRCIASSQLGTNPRARPSFPAIGPRLLRQRESASTVLW